MRHLPRLEAEPESGAILERLFLAEALTASVAVEVSILNGNSHTCKAFLEINRKLVYGGKIRLPGDGPMSAKTDSPGIPFHSRTVSTMRWQKIFPEISLENQTLYYKLNVLFGLFVLYPVLGFLYFAYKYQIFSDRFLTAFFLIVLIFALIGFTILRKLFDRITGISKLVLEKSEELSGAGAGSGTNELQRILTSFNAIERRFLDASSRLQTKASEITILKELSDLCYVTLDPSEILHVTLERALTLTGSDVGSILILKKEPRREFVVKATMGLAEVVKLDDRIDFETSIAKYAVLNKAPLVVENIEKETRFGRINRFHYGTKSFICMPIKTIKDIVGVLTVSCKTDHVYTQEDVEVLTPLLSNAAFTYENLRLMGAMEQRERHLAAIEKIFKLLASSLRNGELLHAIINEIQTMVPFRLAVVLARDKRQTDSVRVLNMLTSEPVQFEMGDRFAIAGSSLEKVLQQETMLIVDDTFTLTNEVDQRLFAGRGHGACILTPLSLGGKPRGVLLLTAAMADSFYAEQDLIGWLANVLALAIEHNELSAEVARRDLEFATIKQIGGALASSTFDISRVLRYTMDMIREIMPVEAGVLYLLRENELEFATGFQVDEEALAKIRLKLGQGLAGSVAARGKSSIINNLAGSPFLPELDELSGSVSRSALCVPIISQARVIGVIMVLNKTSGDFDNNDEDLVLSIASSVSIALENARLYSETVSMAEHERGIRQMFQKFVPKEVLDSILNVAESGGQVLEEFKTLTLLNVDMRGFSALIREIGPQKSVALLNYFFSVMGGIVFKHRGIVDKYLGDGFLALFGAPVSSTRDADNAVNAALEMQQALAGVNEYFVKELGTSVEIGISIHTGEVVVGNIGFEMKMDYTVVGHPVNVVFRMQDLTKTHPNIILVGENTRRATRTRLHLRPFETGLGALKIYELLGRQPPEEQPAASLTA